MNTAVRVGVIGTGFGARIVAPVFDATDGCRVVDVVSARDADAVTALCVRRDVDLISVHSPPFLHLDHVTAAIDAGHAVLCDKPFGRNATDAAAMCHQAEAAGVLALVNFEFRYEPARRHVRDLLRAGAIGRVEHLVWVHVSNRSRVPLRPHGWLFDRSSGGGWLGAWGAHAVDALRWWCGEIEEASGRLRTTIRARPNADGVETACDADDGFRADLGFADGMTATIDSTFAASASLAPRVVILGSEASVEVVADQRVTLRSLDGERSDWTAATRAGDPHLVPMRSWALEVRDAVRQGSVGADLPTFADGLAVRRVLDAIAAPEGQGASAPARSANT